MLGAIVVLRRRARPARATTVLALGLGVFQIGANYALLEGFAHAPAGLVVLLFYIYPLLVGIGAAALFDEPLGARRVVTLAVGFAGIALTVGAPDSAPWLGVVLGLAAGVCTCGYILGARHVMRGTVDAIELSALMYVGPAVVFALVALVRGTDLPPAPALGWAAALVAFGTVVPMALFYAAVKAIGAGTTSLLATIEPLVAVLLAYVVLDESLELAQLVGGALILGAVASLTVQPRARRPEPVPVPPA